MSIPTELKYTKSHEWVKTESDGTVTIGITQHAQNCSAIWFLSSCQSRPPLAKRRMCRRGISQGGS